MCRVDSQRKESTEAATGNRRRFDEPLPPGLTRRTVERQKGSAPAREWEQRITRRVMERIKQLVASNEAEP